MPSIPQESSEVGRPAYEQTVAEDYSTAMQRVEQRLEIVSKPEEEIDYEDVRIQPALASPPGPFLVFRLFERLELPELCFEERCGTATELREVLGLLPEQTPRVKESSPRGTDNRARGERHRTTTSEHRAQEGLHNLSSPLGQGFEDLHPKTTPTPQSLRVRTTERNLSGHLG